MSLSAHSSRPQTTAICDPLYDDLDFLHQQAPVFHHPDDFWCISKYHDVARLLTDKTLISNHPDTHLPYPSPTTELCLFDQMVRHWFIFKNAPEHPKIRSIFNQSFAPRSIRALEMTIESLCSAQISYLKSFGHRPFDLLNELSYPLPLKVICHIMGIPAQDWSLFKPWTMPLSAGLERRNPKQDLAIASQACQEISDYFTQLLKQKDFSDDDSVIGRLVRSQEPCGELSQAQILSLCIFLILSGHETTTNLIASGIALLYQHPDQLALLKAKPELIESAVEEMARLGTALPKALRWTKEDFTLHGQLIPRGKMVSLFIGAANRDIDKFSNPHHFDITRSPNPHLTFGRGVHFCLGTHLAKLETQIVIAMLLKELPDLQVDVSELAWRDLFVFRGLAALPASL